MRGVDRNQRWRGKGRQSQAKHESHVHADADIRLTAAVERRLSGVTDLRDALTSLAKTWFYIRQENAAHLAIIQQAMVKA